MIVCTTEQVAKLLGVCRSTVRVLFDSGKLKGYRNGPLNDRCIKQEDLISFFRKHKIPFILWDNKVYTDGKYYTTTQAARLSGLSVNSIIRCFDSGKLKGFRIPGSLFRRIPKSSFIAFLEENSIPF